MTQPVPHHRDSSKADLRRYFGLLRNEAAAEGAVAAQAVVGHFQSEITLPADAVVAGYWPMRSELDPRPLLAWLGDRGHALVLPVVTGKDKPLIFRGWTPGDVLVEGAFGTREPASTAREIVPDVILVPMLAYDLEGYRLGYGGGFYDRTLSQENYSGKALVIGLAFAVQETQALPREAHDRKLHRIVTDKGTRTFV